MKIQRARKMCKSDGGSGAAGGARKARGTSRRRRSWRRVKSRISRLTSPAVMPDGGPAVSPGAGKGRAAAAEAAKAVVRAVRLRRRVYLG
jgi:hypothetical protein